MGKSSHGSDLWQQVKSIVLRYWQVLTVGALFIIVQLPVLANWRAIWDEQDSYYSHGWLVPFMALFLLWVNRKIITQTPIKPSWYGLLILAVAAPIHSVAMLMELRVLYMLTFFTTLFGILLLFFGWRMVKVVGVPVLFLITMMPIASGVIDSLTANAQLVSAAVATRFLQWTGYEVTRYGNIITGDGLPCDLRVASPCSGLRLLISLITFTWFFTYVIIAPKWKKAILFLMAFPLGVFINSLRITMIGYVGFWIGTEEAVRSFHNSSGYIGLLLCFAILFGIAKLMRCVDMDLEREPTSISQTNRLLRYPDAEACRRSINTKFAVAIVILVGLAYIGNMVEPLYRLPKGKLDRTMIPAKFGDWTSKDIEVDKETRDILQKGDLLSRLYTNSSDRQVHVFLDAGVDLSAFHDPHLCMTGSGNNIVREHQFELLITQPYSDKLRVTSFELVRSDNTGIVLYWYMRSKDSYALTNHLWGLRRQFWISDLKELVTNPMNIDELRKKIKARQFTWYRFSTDRYAGDKSDMQFIESFAREYIKNKKDFGR
ncbi:MAG: exosortase/archaeosortase family protein [Armatimonadetes bacterium]|nr:exosortase/archaeosortase family protein [Armatimonadota bacterium]